MFQKIPRLSSHFSQMAGQRMIEETARRSNNEIDAYECSLEPAFLLVDSEPKAKEGVSFHDRTYPWKASQPRLSICTCRYDAPGLRMMCKKLVGDTKDLQCKLTCRRNDNDSSTWAD